MSAQSTDRPDPMIEALEALIAGRREHERALEEIEAREIWDAAQRRRGHVTEPED